MPNIIRKAHIRKSYFRSDGTLVTSSKIPKTIVKIKKPTIFKGLSRPIFHGYSVKDPSVKRHQALIKVGSPVSVIRRLNALSILTKNTQPKNSKIYASDMHWMQNHR